MKKVLFVCLGNICRSPAAEGLFSYYCNKKNIIELFLFDSCGTCSYHEGESPDKRMRSAALKRGVVLSSLSRSLRKSDFYEFDYIFAMDNSNYKDLLNSEGGKGNRHKILKICDYITELPYKEVPDPYYGDENGFELVLDILSEAINNFLDEVLAE